MQQTGMKCERGDHLGGAFQAQSTRSTRPQAIGLVCSRNIQQRGQHVGAGRVWGKWEEIKQRDDTWVGVDKEGSGS